MRCKESVLKFYLFILHTLQCTKQFLATTQTQLLTDSEVLRFASYTLLKHKMIAMFEWNEQKHSSVI